MNKKIFIMTGEASGDFYGSKLVEAILQKNKKINFYGVGSYAMKKNGVKLFLDSKNLSIMGISEVIPKIPFIIQSIINLKYKIKKIKPELIILIDFPDFNLYIASIAKKLNIPILYYIPPQIWAWRKNRIYKIKQLINYVAVILPFEEKLYKKVNIPVSFVGHPLLDEIFPLPTKSEKNKIKTIGLLPGSRNNEIIKLLPIMLEAITLIKQEMPSVQFLVSRTKSINIKYFNKIFIPYKKMANLEITDEPIEKIFCKCDFLIAASGTVTLQAAIYKIPTLIVYKMSTLNYIIGKLLINTKYIGLPNLILDRKVFPELIQQQVTPHNIAKITINLFKNNFEEIKKKISTIKNRMGDGTTSKRVASIAMNILFNKKYT